MGITVLLFVILCAVFGGCVSFQGQMLQNHFPEHEAWKLATAQWELTKATAVNFRTSHFSSDQTVLQPARQAEADGHVTASTSQGFESPSERGENSGDAEGMERTGSSHVMVVTDFGADPTGQLDSTSSLQAAIDAAFRRRGSNRTLMPGVADLGGVQIHLAGGEYLVSRPLRFPPSGGGNLQMHGGTLRATESFPKDRYLVELRSSGHEPLRETHTRSSLERDLKEVSDLPAQKPKFRSDPFYLRGTSDPTRSQIDRSNPLEGSAPGEKTRAAQRGAPDWRVFAARLGARGSGRGSGEEEVEVREPEAAVRSSLEQGGDPHQGYEGSDGIGFEDIEFRDLMLDGSYVASGLLLSGALRVNVANVYVVHFHAEGVRVEGGHEVTIHDSFLGQHITAGGDPHERDFSGTAIVLAGNDHVVSDVAIFSAAVGIEVTGPANLISGVHMYNKATGWGGVGLYLRLPGHDQTPVTGCYFDYTGLLAEDPTHLDVAHNFFLGNAGILLRATRSGAPVRGLNIVDNMFDGRGGAVPVISLDQSRGSFAQPVRTTVDHNTCLGMRLLSTAVRVSLTQVNATSWIFDVRQRLLFNNTVGHVQFSMRTDAGFPRLALRSTEDNVVLLETDTPTTGTVYLYVNQVGDA